MIEENTQILTLLVHAKTIAEPFQQRLLLTFQDAAKECNNPELTSKRDRMLQMLKMLSMSRSNMHLKALTRVLIEYETIQNDAQTTTTKNQAKINARQSRRVSLARRHRRLSTMSSTSGGVTTATTGNTPPSSSRGETKQQEPTVALASTHTPASEATMTREAVAEAMEHLTDLENEGILSSVLASRGKVLMKNGDEGAILTILKHANNDDALKTYLQYRRTKTEDTTKRTQKRESLNEALDTELMERTLIIQHLSSGRKKAKEILESLEMNSGTASVPPTLTTTVMLTAQQETASIYAEIAHEAKKIAAGAENSRNNGAAQAGHNASMADQLNSNAALDLNSKSIKSFVRIRPCSNNNSHSSGDNAAAIRQTSNTTIQCTTKNQITTTNTVDHIFPENISQSEVFRAVEPMVLCTLVGFNSTIFAYGTTVSVCFVSM